MQRRIELLDKQYITTVSGRTGGHHIRVEDDLYRQACLTMKSNFTGTIRLGDQKAELHMIVKGETAFIRAFGRTFTVRVVDPVEQAVTQASGKKDTASASMPGRVVEVHAAEGETVIKGQPLLTIESMKILTIITAPRNGEVAIVNFKPGRTFDKNAALVTLKAMEDI